MWAKALGAEVYAFSHSSSKKEDALDLGADHFIDTSQNDFEKPLIGEIDLIVSTASNVEDLPLAQYLSTLSVNGRLIYVGMPEDKLPQLGPQDLAANGAFIGSSHIGSKKEAMQMLQLAADKGIKTWKQVIPMSEAAEGIKAIEENTVRFRTVLQQGESSIRFFLFSRFTLKHCVLAHRYYGVLDSRLGSIASATLRIWICAYM
jgi:alcohol dehydrogenase (NADP+)